MRELVSQFEIGDDVDFESGPWLMRGLKVKAIHFTEDKVRYDLQLISFEADGSGWDSTTIYYVDSCNVVPNGHSQSSTRHMVIVEIADEG